MYSPGLPTAHQPSVLTRLQGLFPNSTNDTITPRPGDLTQHDKAVLPTLPPPVTRAPTIDPKFLKVRILTWNMHDSLPKVFVVWGERVVDLTRSSLAGRDRRIVGESTGVLWTTCAAWCLSLPPARWKSPLSSGCCVSLSASFAYQTTI